MVAKQSRRDPEKEQFWRETVKAQARDGQSIREFCREHKLAESAFYFWRRELRRRDAARPASQSSQLPKTTKKASRSHDSDRREIFLPVSIATTNRESTIEMVANKTATPTIEMTLPSGAVLRWLGGDTDALAEWIAKLEAQLC